MSVCNSNHDLYRHYNNAGELLYIGISLSAVSRLGQHRFSAEWFTQIARVEIQKFANRQEVEVAEILAIQKEKPKFNVRHKTLRDERNAVRSGEIAAEFSRGELISRILRFATTYSTRDVAQLIGSSHKYVLEEIEKGNLAFIKVPGHKSARWPIKLHVRITGWQFIDFIEHLQNQTNP